MNKAAATDNAAINAAIEASLMQCAETLGDITPLVYERFFAQSESAQGVMGHADAHMQGRMLEQTLQLLMSDEHLGEGGYLDWELDNHLVGYQVEGHMYLAFFDALTRVVQDGTGDAWPDYAGFWQLRIEQILDQVRAHPATQDSLNPGAA